METLINGLKYLRLVMQEHRVLKAFKEFKELKVYKEFKALVMTGLPLQQA